MYFAVNNYINNFSLCGLFYRLEEETMVKCLDSLQVLNFEEMVSGVSSIYYS